MSALLAAAVLFAAVDRSGDVGRPAGVEVLVAVASPREGQADRSPVLTVRVRNTTGEDVVTDLDETLRLQFYKGDLSLDLRGTPARLAPGFQRLKRIDHRYAPVRVARGGEWVRTYTLSAMLSDLKPQLYKVPYVLRFTYTSAADEPAAPRTKVRTAGHLVFEVTD